MTRRMPATSQAGAAAGSFQVQVKVKNQAGDELTASGTVKVQNLY